MRERAAPLHALPPRLVPRLAGGGCRAGARARGAAPHTGPRSPAASPRGLSAGDGASPRSATRARACAASGRVAAPALARRAAATARRSGHGPSRRRWRTGGTLPTCPGGCGPPAALAAVSPGRPSTPALTPSGPPRCGHAGQTECQPGAPALSLRPRPRSAVAPSLGRPRARSTACVCPGPAGRAVTRRASTSRRGDTEARGRACPVRPSSHPAAVRGARRVGAPSVPSHSARGPGLSRGESPRASRRNVRDHRGRGRERRAFQ
jgi:hypothetical protein